MYAATCGRVRLLTIRGNMKRITIEFTLSINLRPPIKR